MPPATTTSASEKTARNLRVCAARIDGLIAELVAHTGTGPLGDSVRGFEARWLENSRLVEADIALLSERRSPRTRKQAANARRDGGPDLAQVRAIVEAISRTAGDLTLLAREVDELRTDSAQPLEPIHRIGMAVQNQSMTIRDLSGILHEFVMDVSHPNLASDLKLTIEGDAAAKVRKLSPQLSIALLYELEAGTQHVFKVNPPVSL